MKFKIAVIHGDGIGPEVTDAALSVLSAVGIKFGHTFEVEEALLGGQAIERTGAPLPSETVDICKSADAVLIGPVGGKKWDSQKAHLRPEKALNNLRSNLNLYANVTPCFLHQPLINVSPLKPDIAKKPFNFLIVRDVSAGIYVGDRGYRQGKNGEEAYDTEVYTEAEIDRIARLAFAISQTRERKVVSVDRADIFESGKLWRQTVQKVALDFPDVEVEHMLFNHSLRHLLLEPSYFDTILAPAMFGDILCAQATTICGASGLLPSYSMGNEHAIFGVRHGVAESIAGQDLANPIATILSLAIMLASKLGLTREAAMIEKSLAKILDKGFRTADIASGKSVACSRFAELVALEVLN